MVETRKKEHSDESAYRASLAKATKKYEKVDEECDEIMDSLVAEAEKMTWELCEKLEKEGKLSEENISSFHMVKEDLKKNPACFDLRRYDVMFYDFSGSISPYRSLYVRRYKENGQYVAPVLARNKATEYHYSVEHDQQLVEFEKELASCGKINYIQSDEDWDRCYLEGVEIGKELKISGNEKFDALCDADVFDCVHCMLLPVFEIEQLKKKEKFCLEFLEERVQDRSRPESGETYKKFLSEMDEKYKMPFGVNSIENAMELVFRLGGDTTIMREHMETITDARKKEEYRSNWLKERQKEIRAHVKAQMAECRMSKIKCADYVKLKLKCAEEIGIIVKKRRGQYSEKYGHLFLRRRVLDQKLLVLDQKLAEMTRDDVSWTEIWQK